MARRSRRLDTALTALLVACAALASACSDGGGDDQAADVAMPELEPGTTMERLHERGRIRFGVSFDQPGLGHEKPGARGPEGLDIEISKIIAGRLRIPEDRIEWVETVPRNREVFLQRGIVDLVVSAYSITDERRRIVGQAGPYYTTGQQLLVRKGEKRIRGPEDLRKEKVCALAGTTSIKRIKDEYQAVPMPRTSHDACVRDLLAKRVNVVTADGAALLGYFTENPRRLAVVGKPFSEERFGIGYPKGDTDLCEFLNDTLSRAFQDGEWDNALLDTLWKYDRSLPDYPVLDPCG